MPWTADQNYYLTSERDRAVPEGDSAAAFLLIGKGGSLSLADARKYGLVQEEADEQPAQPEAAPEPEAKAVKAAPQNKAIRMGKD